MRDILSSLISRVARCTPSSAYATGTFSSDVKVAVEALKAGNVGGEYEASSFYQVTLPTRTDKPVTLRMKAGKADDVAFVVLSSGFCPSRNRTLDNELYLEAEYSDGEYTATLPAFTDDDSGDYGTITMGLGHMTPPDGEASRSMSTRSFTNTALASGKVDKIKYEVYISWQA